MEEISKTEKSLQSGTYSVKNENKLNTYAFCTEVHFCLASPAQFRAIGLELDIWHPACDCFAIVIKNVFCAVLKSAQKRGAFVCEARLSKISGCTYLSKESSNSTYDVENYHLT